MNPVIVILGIVVTLALAGLAVHFLLTWMNRKGWVWYRNPTRPPPTSLGLIEEIYQPSVEHVIEHGIEDETVADQNESGEGDRGISGP